MKSNPLPLIAAVLAVYVLLANPEIKAPWDSTPPVNVPGNVLIEPSPELKQLVAPMTGMYGQDPTAATDISGWFLSMARLVEKGQLTTTGQIQQINASAGSMLLNGSAKQRFAAIGAAAENAMVQAWGGLDNKQLDAGMRQRTQDTYRAMAWAVMEKKQQTFSQPAPMGVSNEVSFFLALGGLFTGGSLLAWSFVP